MILGWAGAGWSQERPVPLVRDIVVEGNQRIQPQVVLNRIQTKIGDPFSPAALREDVRAIFALGFFDDAQVRVEEFEGGIRVIFIVVERPLLREAAFEGNFALTTEEVREAAALRIGVLYNPVEVQRAVDALRQKYEDEGFFGVTIAPRTERTLENDLRVVFRIDEGRKMYIDRIVIDGNQALTDRQIKAAMETKERFLWILPFSKVHRRVFQDDAERILNLYADHGHIQARIESHEILPDVERGKITLRTRLVEGVQFRLGSVEIQGHSVLAEDEIRGLLKLKAGDVFNRSLVRDSVRGIADRYSAIGRARAEVVPRTDVRSEERFVDLMLTIAEGPEIYVERINITGNTKSAEQVLRRELRVQEGELFTYQKLVRSRQRLFNLGYFEEVNATVEPGSAPDKLVVNIDVRERPTGVFSIGAGYSSVDKLFGTLDITQRNLFGRGQEVFLRIRFGSRTQLGLLGFTEPYLFGIPLRAGFDIYNREREFDDFTEERIGGDLRASYPIGEFSRISSLYRLEEVEVRDVFEGASQTLKDEAGDRLNSVIELSLTYDSRDNIFEPSSGGRHSIEGAFAGIGGDTRWYRLEGETAYYQPLPFWRWVVGARALAGYVQGWGGEEVPLFERFFLGGPNSLRGQRARSVSPRDDTGAVIGGTSQLLVSTELLIPLIQRIRLALFFDAGNAYGFGTDFDPLDVRLAAGVGIRFLSPLGPLRLDWGWNVDREPGEKSNQINFTVGAPF